MQSFYSTREWFHDELAKNRLYHAGEFGAARESIVRKLILNVLGSRFRVSHGFILNPSDGRTTQCDIVIYDPCFEPLIDEASGIRFFSAESVVGIGEVKSVLDKTRLKDAILKISKNKTIRDCLNGRMFRTGSGCSYFHTGRSNYDAPFTFLVCEKIEGFDPDLNSWIVEKYDLDETPCHLRHNLILDLKNGVLSYEPACLSQIVSDFTGTWSYPTVHESNTPSIPMQFSNIEPEKNVEFFINALVSAVHHATVLPTDSGSYAG